MLRLQTLGGLAFSDEAGLLAGACAQRKPLGLLVVLALAGEQGATREKLAGLFWGEHDEVRARASLKQMLYLLRRDAGHSGIIEGTTTLRLNPALVSVDVLEFMARCKASDFEDATALYRGPFLDGVFLEGSPELEEWCDAQRARLHQLYTRALAGRVETAAAAGDHVASLEPLRRLVDTAPLEGKWVALLVRQLEQVGELSEALRVAERHAGQIEAELGTALPAELVATIERLRRGRVDLPPTSLPAVPAPLDVAQEVAPAPAPRETAAAGTHVGPFARRTVRSWKRVVGLAAACLLVLAPALALRPRPVPRRSPVPVVLIRDFEDLAGPDGSPAWATILANRVAEALAARVEVVRDSARPGQLRPGEQDLTIAGRYFSAGDTLFVQAKLFGHATATEIDTIVDVRVVGGQIDLVADTLVQHVRTAVDRVVDSARVAWGLAPTDSVDAGAWTWFLLAHDAVAAHHDCDAALAFLDSAAQADPGFALPALYRIRCYGPEPPYRPRNSRGLARVRREFADRVAQLSPAERAYYRYFSAMADYNQDSALAAARTLAQVLPQSSRTRGWLAAALMRQNHFAEVLEVTRPDLEGVPGIHDADGWRNIFFRVQALHLLSRNREELQLVEAQFNRDFPERLFNRRTVEFLRIRALAGVGDTLATHREILAALRPPDPLITGFANPDYPEEELRAHGMTRLADTLALLVSEDRCRNKALYSAAILPFDDGVSGYVEFGEWPDTLSELALLTKASHALRLGCVPDAAARLRMIQAPIRDSLYYQAVRGELAARQGDVATASMVSGWLQDGLEHGRLSGWRPVYLQARLAAVRDNRALALGLLSTAIRLGMPYELSVHTDPLWTGYGEDPTFRALLAR